MGPAADTIWLMTRSDRPDAPSIDRWFGKIEGLHSLPASCRDYLELLNDLLDCVQPALVNRAASEVAPHRHGVFLTIAHSREPDHSLLVDVSDDEVTVSFGSEHEHFSRDDAADGRIWPFDKGEYVSTSLFFIEQLLTGRIRVEIIRRPLQIKARSYWLSEDGRPELFLRSGTFLPVFGWSRSPVVEQISFVAPPLDQSQED